MAIDAKEQFLPRFSRRKLERHVKAEPGLYNLSSLKKECEKKDVRVEISLSQIPRRVCTLINLAFQL